MSSTSRWKPTEFRRFIRNHATSTGVAQIMTDAGPAYLKALGNPEGPHALASEWVGTQLAHLFGLQTFDVALLGVDARTDEVPLPKGGHIQTGPAFCSRAEAGRPWDGTAQDLDRLDNARDITRLVVFDTWIRNRDRHHPDYQVRRPNRDNVFFSEDKATPEQYRLVAMDHTHCFAVGSQLNRRLADIGNIRDEAIYGLFPEFGRFLRRDVVLASTADLKALSSESVWRIITSIPREWDVDTQTQNALNELVCGRAGYVADNFLSVLERDYICLL